MASSPGEVSVALLCGPGGFGNSVRESMGALGAPVVYEAEPQAFDRDALEHSQANVVVVNLDARSDADLDNVYALLDDARYRVVFNDEEVSGSLTGWDQARWMRHLAAKILGDADIDPPRPVDAEAVPIARKPTPTTSAQAPVATTRLNPPSEETTAVAGAEIAHAERVDLIESNPVASTGRASSATTSDVDSLVDGFDAAPVAPVWHALESAHPASPTAFDTTHHTQDTIIDAVDLAGFDDLAFDLDVPASAAPPAVPVDAGAPLDVDFDLDALDFDLPDAPVMTDAGERDDQPNVPGLDVAEPDFDSLPAAGNDFALELESATESPGTLTASTDSTAAEAPAGAVLTNSDDDGSGFAFPSNEWTLEDVLDEMPAVPPMPAGSPAFGIEKLRAEEFLAPNVEANPAHPFDVSQGLSLELIPLDEAVAPLQSGASSHENWLDPDAAQPKVRRVWVLGASIGGPEAVREFLAALPRDYPALFVLAQHLGDEFVDMMAKQLAHATALTVRIPTHGERVGHGEVVIAPNGKRFLVDPMGVVVLERDTEERAFSPSIDCVLRDIADRFGSNAGAIVFSGMTDDAVEGCQYLAQQGGLVYAQSHETCVVSTMIDGVCAAGIVKFQGSPRELAEKLIAG